MSNKTLVKNPYGWTEYASIIYLESPIGVGFSYSTSARDYDFIGDSSTTNDNERALEKFLEKFPKFGEKNFYVMGESYAGIYIPLLIERLSRNPKFRHILKGAAIGNGMHEYEINFNTQIFYAHSHGLIGPYLWGEILSDCCRNITEQCNFYAANNTDICALEISEVADLIRVQIGTPIPKRNSAEFREFYFWYKSIVPFENPELDLALSAELLQLV